MTDKIREAFEAWAINNVFNLQRAGERYFFTSTHDAWCGYKAAISSLEPIPRSESGLETLYRIAAPKGDE